MKRVPMESDFTPPFLRIPAGKPQGLLPKRSSQQETRGEQGVSRQGQERPQMRKEIKLPSMSTASNTVPVRSVSRLPRFSFFKLITASLCYSYSLHSITNFDLCFPINDRIKRRWICTFVHLIISSMKSR